MIFGKCGRLGHGKTMRAVVDAIELARKRGADEGRCWMAGNIGVRVPEGWRYDLLPMDDFGQHLAVLMSEAVAASVGLVVIVDEIDTVWDAHAWQDMRKTDRYRLKQSRKYGADLFWTAQFVDQAEKSIRNITETIELLRALPSPSIERRERGKRPWLIRGQMFRPGAVRELTAEQDKDKRMGSSWHRYKREHEALYDTDELVVPVDVESLCSRHAKEIRESRCPRCHPPVPVAGELVTDGLSAFAMVASATERPPAD